MNILWKRGESEMAISVYQELEKYAKEIEYLSSGSKSIDELVEYLKSIDVSTSTVRDHKRLIKSGAISLINFSEPSTVSLNRKAIEELVAYLCGVLRVESTNISGTSVDKSLSNLKTTSAEKNATIEGLKKKVDELTGNVKEYKKKLSDLEKEREEQFKSSFEMPVVLVSTEEVLPKATAWERQLVIRRNSEDYDDSKKENKKKPAVTAKKEDGFILTFRNYVKRGIQGILTKSFMTERIKLLLQNQGMSEFASDKQYVNSILGEPSFTNQQKLALYAAFSDYRHTDFERLLNFAGDNDVDANLLIQWVESLGDEQDFKQIKNALRQFAKPTEYKLKYELAWELLLGYWQVEFYKDGVPTRFRLIAESDIEKIRGKLGLSESAFTYHDYVTYENVSDKKVEKEETMVKKKIQDKLQENKQIEAPKFIQRYFMKDNDIFPDDYDLPEEPINYGEFENDERG